MTRRVSRLVVVVLLGLCAVQTGRDLSRFDRAPRITSERRVGEDSAVAPSKGGRVDQDRSREAKPGDLAPVAIGPADPAAPAGGLRRSALGAPDDRGSVSATSGSSRPRAPPVA